jgi:hypothetical protein
LSELSKFYENSSFIRGDPLQVARWGGFEFLGGISWMFTHKILQMGLSTKTKKSGELSIGKKIGRIVSGRIVAGRIVLESSIWCKNLWDILVDDSYLLQLFSKILTPTRSSLATKQARNTKIREF